MADRLTHFDAEGASRMVDVSGKEVSQRVARVSGRITMRSETLSRITGREMSKGDVLEVARLAGIMAAKRTDMLIPLCHQVPLSRVTIAFDVLDERTLKVEAEVAAVSVTGVEMEALVAVSTAALTVYDMCKAIDREMVIGPIQLEEKSGGRSGHFQRQS